MQIERARRDAEIRRERTHGQSTNSVAIEYFQRDFGHVIRIH